MKGVILAGGLGSRLRPMTLVTNKHLLPVYDRPMIYYPIQCLVNAGIKDILVVTGGNSSGDFLKLLGNGKAFGIRGMQYAYQEGEGGIAEALDLAEYFAQGDSICVVLGDNIIEGNIVKAARGFESQKKGAKILLKEVEDPQRFGVVALKDGKVTEIIEKPKDPPTNKAVIGIYFYDATVFSKIKKCERSARGELEITDVNNMYLREGTLSHDVLEGWWSDAGTVESLHRVSSLVAKTGANKV
ncbi:MAG: sugar phosphate nucleotidyltransferase [Planctomycetota bacterium]